MLFSSYEAGGLTLAEIIETTLRMSKLGLIDIYEQARLGEGSICWWWWTSSKSCSAIGSWGPPARARPGVSEDAMAFVNLLLEVREQTTCPIYVVLTMRSDFLGDCAQFPGLPEAINAGQYLVPRLTRDERRAAISGPGGGRGGDRARLADASGQRRGDNPDQLSILQHALNRTWAHWQHEGGGKGRWT